MRLPISLAALLAIALAVAPPLAAQGPGAAPSGGPRGGGVERPADWDPVAFLLAHRDSLALTRDQVA
ncbi:MAG TPA: hypothetical protein VHG91_11380, partial [Longimicrobium sp.]|nr:hypothetical protein [Longimicrobium sp.]